jgi:phosphoglycerate dehydrogenase-like enzyme
VKIAILDDYQGVALQMADWDSLAPQSQVTVFREHWNEAQVLAERLVNFEAVVAMRERTAFPAQILEGLPGLRLLVTTGMRNAAIDLEAATRLGVLVCGTRGGGPSTAELAWALILSLARHIPQEFESVRGGHWETTIGTDLAGKKLGLLGLGNLGSKMAVIGRAFGMSVIAWSQNLTAERASQFEATLVSKEELFRQADFLSIHLQLSARTRGLVGAAELSLMKESAYLVNTSRGPIIEQRELIRALRSKRIAGAGLDVFDQEPLPADNLWRGLENAILTPHLGYVTRETYQIFYGEAVEDISSYLAGQPVRMLNPAALEGSRKRGPGA